MGVSFEDIRQSGAADYLLRTTQQHHVQLSLMADQKASIMIAAASILLTFTFSNLDHETLSWGFRGLFGFSSISLGLAILAVTPRTAGAKPSGQRNLLFFGDFADMTLDEYSESMDKVLRSDETIYQAIVADIHAIGMSLRTRKYRYLTMSYRWFLAGIIVAAVLFTVQAIVNGGSGS
jgi:hypothetical protein